MSIDNTFFPTPIDDPLVQRFIDHQHIIEEIYAACGGYKYPCGSYLFDGTLGHIYNHADYEKQKHLYEAVKDKTSVLEVGVYMGHSLLIMLISNPKLIINAVDIDDTYARPATEILKKYFPHATIRFWHGKIDDFSPSIFERADFIHHDADHELEGINSDLSKMVKFSMHREVEIMIDDIRNITDVVIEGGTYKLITNRAILFTHDIKHDDADLLMCVHVYDINTFVHSITSIVENSHTAFKTISVYVDEMETPQWLVNELSRIPLSVQIIPASKVFTQHDFDNIAGWYRQQLVKLWYANKTNATYYLMWDSDMIANQRVEFIDDGNPVMYLLAELMHSTGQPIHHRNAIRHFFPDTYNTIFDTYGVARFISSFMAVRSSDIRSLLETIVYHRLLDYCIELTRNKTANGFSEFELIAYWMITNRVNKFTVRRITTALPLWKIPYPTKQLQPTINVITAHRYIEVTPYEA